MNCFIKFDGSLFFIIDQIPYFGDFIVFKSKTRSGGHIGFVQEITSNGVIKVLGGNQGNNAKVSNYQFESNSQYVRSIRRNWSLTPEQDVPIDGTAAAQAGSDTTV